MTYLTAFVQRCHYKIPKSALAGIRYYAFYACHPEARRSDGEPTAPSVPSRRAMPFFASGIAPHSAMGHDDLLILREEAANRAHCFLNQTVPTRHGPSRYSGTTFGVNTMADFRRYQSLTTILEQRTRR
jgi:hypothetical protein